MKKYIINNVEYIVNRKAIDENDTDIIYKIISYLISKKNTSFKQEDKNVKK